MKRFALTIPIALLVACAGSDEAEFPKGEQVNVSAERTNWEVSRLTGDRVATSNTFELSTALLTEEKLSLCLKTVNTVEEYGIVRYRPNEEECTDYEIREWSDDRFLARPDMSGSAFSFVCQVNSKDLNCYTIADGLAPDVTINPERNMEAISEQTVIRLR